MSNEVKKDKDYIIAKMNHKVTIFTALVGLIATLSAVVIPIMNTKASVDNNPAVTTTPTKEQTTSTPTASPTPTVTKKAGKDK